MIRVEKPSGRTLAAASAAGALLLSACGADVSESEGSAEGYPVTVENCGEERTFDQAPERAVTNDVNMAEMMFALGLEDHMAGYVLGSSVQRNAETSPWAESFEDVPMLGEKLNKEMVQGADADLMFAGWNYGFTESDGLTPEAFEEAGIDSYVLTESCRQGDSTTRGIMDPIDALYTDIENLGEIFGVQDRARDLLAEYDGLIDGAENAVPEGREAPRVFLYDDGTDQPFTVGRNAAGNSVIERAGGANIFDDLDDSWTDATFEAAADRNPQVILINDYGSGDAKSVEAKEQFLRDHPLMSGTEAVEEGNFFSLPYPALTEGPSNPQAIADFAEYLNGAFPQ